MAQPAAKSKTSVRDLGFTGFGVWDWELGSGFGAASGPSRGLRGDITYTYIYTAEAHRNDDIPMILYSSFSLTFQAIFLLKGRSLLDAPTTISF